MSRRPWIKIHCEGILKMVSEGWKTNEIGVWITLLAIAGNGNYGDIGVIAHTPTVGASVNDIASLCGVSVRNWYRYRDKFVNESMITVNSNNVIIINNYAKYQSKYSDKSVNLTMFQNDGSVIVSKSKNKKENKNKRIGTSTFVDNSQTDKNCQQQPADKSGSLEPIESIINRENSKLIKIIDEEPADQDKDKPAPF